MKKGSQSWRQIFTASDPDLQRELNIHLVVGRVLVAARVMQIAGPELAGTSLSLFLV